MYSTLSRGYDTLLCNAQTYASMNRHDESKRCTEKAFLAWASQEHTDKITFYLEAFSVYVTLIVSEQITETENETEEDATGDCD